jgi:hypothetical protein
MTTPMISIGNRAVIANFPQLQVPKGDEVRINLDVQGWKLQITVAFLDQGSDQGIEVKPEPNGVRLVFRNWSNSIGAALKVPAQLAVLSDGSAVEFLAANYRVGDTNLFSLQLLHSKVQK